MVAIGDKRTPSWREAKRRGHLTKMLVAMRSPHQRFAPARDDTPRINQIIVLALVLFCAFSLPAHALPLTGISLRLVPKTAAESGVAPKIVEISKIDDAIRLKWFSLVKDPVDGLAYPTYKVRTNRGVLDVDDLRGKNAFFHPHLWGQAFVSLGGSLPLWVSPEYLELSGKASQGFNVGFLNLSSHALQAAPDRLYEELRYFQNLYDHYFDGRGVNREAKLSKSDEKELKIFREDFFKMGLVAKTEAKLIVNKKVTTLQARILGNRYYQIVVLDDPVNPLVVSLRILTDKVPRVFHKNFEFLKENFEFQVTQVNY